MLPIKFSKNFLLYKYKSYHEDDKNISDTSHEDNDAEYDGNHILGYNFNKKFFLFCQCRVSCHF